ncbi:MAG: BON domain-containing protein, partial [Pseudomonadota bacterium]
MKHSLLVTLLALSGMSLLGSCAPVIVGGAATGSAVIADERTSGSFLDDEAIEVKATLAIADDKSLTDVHINVTSINGVVLLTGEAPTEAQRAKILDHVRTVPRVRRTVNEIRIA